MNEEELARQWRLGERSGVIRYIVQRETPAEAALCVALLARKLDDKGRDDLAFELADPLRPFC